MKQKIGFTSTVPIEIVFSAGLIPVDLNNIFITSENPPEYIQIAEDYGFPRSYCSWIKGLFGVIIRHKIKKIIGIVQGDCSDTHSLLNILALKNIECIPFSYPYGKNKLLMKDELQNLMDALNVSWDDVFNTYKDIQPIREIMYEIDEYSFTGKHVPSKDLHMWQVSASDFNGDYKRFKRDISGYIKGIKDEKNVPLRLGYIGVPPIVTDLYDFIDAKGARVMYQEVQRQFTFPKLWNKEVNDKNLKKEYIKQYLDYTYPYSVFNRIEDIQTEIKRRGLKGIIHYVQSFCHRQAEDIVFRKQLDIPILTLEEDRPGKLSARSKVRLEAFINMIKDK
ncbi:MAG: 2-hydroxyacyl-CoA dehydratase [Elusimicrobiota bacterium]